MHLLACVRGSKGLHLRNPHVRQPEIEEALGEVLGVNTWWLQLNHLERFRVTAFSGMDYRMFLVRPPGQPGSNRASRGGLRLFRILDHGISVLPLGTPNAAPTEYRFEHISKILAADDDPTELRIEILDMSKSGFGFETVRFCCEARTSLLTALLNRVDDMNGIGMCLLLLSIRSVH